MASGVLPNCLLVIVTVSVHNKDLYRENAFLSETSAYSAVKELLSRAYPQPSACSTFRNTSFASSNVSLEPTSYHKPGTFHVKNGVRLYIHCTNRPGWSGLFPSSMY